MAHGGKDIENRDWEPWPAIIGERIALHAGKHYDYDGAEFIRGILGARVTPMPQTTPFVVVAVTTVIGWVYRDDKDHCKHSLDGSRSAASVKESPWFIGPYGWVVRDTFALPKPVPCRGQRLLWTLPHDVERAVLAQLPEAA